MKVTELNQNETRPEELWAEIHRLRDQLTTKSGMPIREFAARQKMRVVKYRTYFRHALFVLTSDQFDLSDPDVEQKRIEFFKEKFKGSEPTLEFLAPLIGLRLNGEEEDNE